MLANHFKKLEDDTLYLIIADVSALKNTWRQSQIQMKGTSKSKSSLILSGDIIADVHWHWTLSQPLRACSRHCEPPPYPSVCEYIYFIMCVGRECVHWWCPGDLDADATPERLLRTSGRSHDASVAVEYSAHYVTYSRPVKICSVTVTQWLLLHK